MKLQLQRMYQVFGAKQGHICKDCCNFVRGRYHDKFLQKCQRYGLSHSEASDWAQKWTACGMHNISLPDIERPLKEYYQDKIENLPEMDGQMQLGETL